MDRGKKFTAEYCNPNLSKNCTAIQKNKHPVQVEDKVTKGGSRRESNCSRGNEGRREAAEMNFESKAGRNGERTSFL